ncbi:hypothetical protein [Paractinoplanes ferrugineus]|uniref:hypothetical protein n=1 Tax=Paractinoplanes ferrugineus TaxID=113564 RepID=UPI001944FFC7|nr:hypothetical protein [Actinoplanes ferrugineus]
MIRREVLAAAAAVTVGALLAPSRALAAQGLAAQGLAAQAVPTIVADPELADREFVRWLSVHDPRAAVRSAARSALISSGGAAASTAFLTAGYKSAADRAAQTRARQLDYANRMADTHAVQFYPWVNASAVRAVNGTDAELAEFSSTGYAAALAKDKAKTPYDDGAALVTEADRSFVVRLAVSGQIPAVTSRALRVETDAEVAEFLRYGWFSAAGIDLDSFRGGYVDDEWQRWHDARQMTAAGAWTVLLSRLARQPTLWAERQRFALDRVDAWTRALQLAGSAGTPLLTAATTKGSPVRTQWTSEASDAAEQTVWWSDLIAYAETGGEDLDG